MSAKSLSAEKKIEILERIEGLRLRAGMMTETGHFLQLIMQLQIHRLLAANDPPEKKDFEILEKLMMDVEAIIQRFAHDHATPEKIYERMKDASAKRAKYVPGPSDDQVQ